MLGVVASTGGPNAAPTRAVWADCPRAFRCRSAGCSTSRPRSSMASSHRAGRSFVPSAACTPWPATAGNPGSGRRYQSPADRHLTVEGGRLRSTADEPRVPAASLRHGAVPVDGPQLLGCASGRRLRRHGRGRASRDCWTSVSRGGYTIAEDEFDGDHLTGCRRRRPRLKAVCELLRRCTRCRASSGCSPPGEVS